MFITCAQCETADATLWCKVENLHFCEPCSKALHAKRARKHHHVEPFVAVPICDECEAATAEEECVECSGTDAIALVFCKECSLSLHSRVARSRHHVKVSSTKRKRDSDVTEQESPTAGPSVIVVTEQESPTAEPSVIDLTAIDSDEEHRLPRGFSSKDKFRASSSEGAPIKQEGLSSPCKVARTVANENPSKPVKPNDEAPACSGANGVAEVPVKTPVNEVAEVPVKTPVNEVAEFPVETPVNQDPGKSVKPNNKTPASSYIESNLERPGQLKDEDSASPSHKQKTVGIEDPEKVIKLNDEAEVEGDEAHVEAVEAAEVQVEENETQVDVDEAPVPESSTVLPDNKLRREEISSSDSDADITYADAERDGVRVIRRGTISVEAFVVDDLEFEEDARPRPSATVPESNSEVSIKNKIKNMLELGLHPNTPEFEAQQALKNAQRLLNKYNLEQIDVMGSNLEDGRSSFTGGMRMVEIRSKGKVKYGRMERWIRRLCSVIRWNFDCENYYERATASQPLRIVFFGIRQNANCAGYAFAATFNRITVMAAAYGPVDDSATKPTPAPGRGVET